MRTPHEHANSIHAFPDGGEIEMEASPGIAKKRRIRVYACLVNGTQLAWFKSYDDMPVGCIIVPSEDKLIEV